ncbi:unnamed protein product, partial [Microthlaspi erraticum]
MGHEEHGGTWHMEAAQLDTQRKKGEAILKTSSTVHSTTRPTGRVPQLDRPSFNSIELGSQNTGANVNIMSKRIADKIGLTKIQPSSISINYADSFSQTPYGFVPNVMVQIGNCSIPTDFQIVEMRESSHRPLIFGTPFLSTVGAIFDFPNQRISFNKVNKGMFFPMCSTKNSFVDMVQEEKVTLKPPQEGETEETIKEDPIPKPKQLATQARSKTKAPTPKPPKGSSKIEDEAKPRRRLENLGICAKGHHGEIVYPAVNHPPDTHCKEKRLGGSKMPLVSIFSERQALQIEGEKGVKTQSAPNHWPRTRRKILAEQFPTGPTVTVEPGRNGLCSAGLFQTRDRNRPRGTHGQKGTARSAGFMYRNGPTVTVDPGNKRSASAEISRPHEIWPTKSHGRDKILGHRPKTFL